MQSVVRKTNATYVKRFAQMKTSSHGIITEYAEDWQTFKDKANTFKDKANTFAFKDKAHTFAFKNAASTRLRSKTQRLVTRRFGIDGRRFKLLKNALRKAALRQITEQSLKGVVKRFALPTHPIAQSMDCETRQVVYDVALLMII